MNFIIDFGGVLYRINSKITIEEFKAKSRSPELLDDLNILINKFVTPFEKGLLSSINFRQEFSKYYNLKISPTEFDNIWNSLLLGIMPESIEIIKELKHFGKLILLSNTNEIHFKHFSSECTELFSLFDELFFSFHIGLVKPDLKIFKYVLDKTAIKPEETYFVDDSEKNIIAATNLKINAFQINHQNNMSDFLHTVKSIIQNFKFKG